MANSKSAVGSSVIHGVDYGPLALLGGVWQGDRGVDVAPEPDGTEESPFYETITFEAIGTVTNAEAQEIAALIYRQVVRRKSNDEVFHDQTGYWMWDAAQKLVMQSLTIPRGVCLLAGGHGETNGDHVHIQVLSAEDNPEWTIVQSPFMKERARTISFVHRIDLDGKQLSYHEATVLDIYGRHFDHTDENTLIRVE